MAVAAQMYNKYADNAVALASKEELTLMLYDGALRFINQAIDALEDKDIQKTHNLIIRVQDIIREFQMTLDFAYEISHQFNNLYDYIHRRLVEGNIKKDIEALHESRDLIREMRDTWKEAMLLAKQN